MKNLTRQEAKEKVRLLGGNVSESISRKTNYLVVGENPGEKLAQAKKLKIKTISEQEFFDLLT
jgi:DNA ligase (NAD+)